MGATSIEYFAKKSKYERPIDAYRALVEEAEWEYGQDPYSGTIATCEYMGKCETPATLEEYDLILDSIQKREVYYYDTSEYYVFIGWAAC